MIGEKERELFRHILEHGTEEDKELVRTVTAITEHSVGDGTGYVEIPVALFERLVDVLEKIRREIEDEGE